MSVSRGLAFWRLARAAPRAVQLATLNYKSGPLRRVLPLSSHIITYPGSSEDPPGPGSMSNLESANELNSDDPTVTSDPDDPELTSDSDSETTSDEEMSSDSDDPDLTSDPDDARIAVLEAALVHVPSLGWTAAALEAGASDMELDQSVDEMFPRGGGELIDHFEVQCNQNLLDYMKERLEQESVKGSELLEDAVEHRLRMIIPFIDKWPQAMAVKAFPTNAPTALENLALMVDDIWYCAGDRSTDFNWYTKRGLLATVYSTTEVFLVQDTSVDFKDTWSFLHHRLEDANLFAKTSKEFQGVVSGGVETVSAGVNAALNVLGINRSR